VITLAASIITVMKLAARVALPMLIIAPTVVLGLLTIAPRPTALTDAWQKVRLYESNDQGVRAIPYYEAILTFQPQRFDIWERIGSLNYDDGHFEQAVEAFQTAAANQSLTPRGYFDLGNAYYELGNQEAASQAWMQILLLNPDLELISELVATFRKAGMFDGALQAAQLWREVDPQSTQAAWSTGLFLSSRDPELAIQHLTAARDGEGPEAALARQLLEIVSLAVLRTEPAYQLAVIGQRLGELGQWDVAEDSFLRAVEITPNYAEAWALLGEARQNLGKDGWNDLLQARTLDPDSEIVLSALVVYWKRQKEYPNALSYLRKLADKNPTEGRWQAEIGATYALAGDLIMAMGAYQQAVTVEPDNPDNWRTLAIFSATYGFDAEAYSIPAIERALELAPSSASVLDAAGWVFLLNGDMEKAEQFLQQALIEDDDYGSAQLHLAQVFIETNRLSQALPLLKAVIKQTSDPSVALQAQRLLEKYFPGQ